MKKAADVAKKTADVAKNVAEDAKQGVDDFVKEQKKKKQRPVTAKENMS